MKSIVFILAIVGILASFMLCGCATIPEQQTPEQQQKILELFVKVTARHFGQYMAIAYPVIVAPGLVSCELLVGEGSEALVALLVELKAEWLEKITKDKILMKDLQDLVEALLLPLDQIGPNLQLDPETEHLVRIAMIAFCEGLPGV